MKSIRDLVNKMPETRKALEDRVLEYSPAIRAAVEKNPAYRADLSRVVDDTFDKYAPYLGGIAHDVSAAGHAVGYAADAWLMTGDVIGSLGGKFINLLAQIPEKAYSVVYGMRTGDYLGSMKNIFEGVLSYVPGFTAVDEGLSRIVQKRMINRAAYEAENKFGLEHTPWHINSRRKAQESYSDVEDHSHRIVSPQRAAA